MAQLPTKQHNTIRSFALVCVAVTSLCIMGMRFWGTMILIDADWCDRAIGASEDAGLNGARSIEAIRACFELLNKQVDYLGWNSHIDTGTLGLCLLALMVIVVAGGRLNFSASTSGASGSIGPAGEPLDDRAQGAAETAGAAVDKANEVMAEEAAKNRPSQPPAPAAPAGTDILE